MRTPTGRPYGVIIYNIERGGYTPYDNNINGGRLTTRSGKININGAVWEPPRVDYITFFV
ncbi:MAG: hypothetical protein VR72_15565 [Clostridiaceae bacterium BRH_c20a]|nr:MAG: hypothetical protein VR72_15565 [Clostridiaceae bacterium BRH_c20a]